MQKRIKLIKYGDVMDYTLRSISGPLAYAFQRVGISPNTVTLVRSCLMLVVMCLFAQGRVMTIVWGGILLQVCDILDYVDGDLARLIDRPSKLGEWMEYVENNFQGTTGSLLGFSLILGIFNATLNVQLWVLLFFLVFGVHMKKSLIVTSVKSDHWVFNILERSSFDQFQNTMETSLVYRIGRLFVWISTRDINLIFLASVFLPLSFASHGFLLLNSTLLLIAIAHNATWLGIAFFQLRHLCLSSGKAH